MCAVVKVLIWTSTVETPVIVMTRGTDTARTVRSTALVYVCQYNNDNQ